MQKHNYSGFSAVLRHAENLLLIFYHKRLKLTSAASAFPKQKVNNKKTGCSHPAILH
jgi:hypothetical protein